jgi:hypothetical protein
MNRILRNAGATLRQTFYADEVATAADGDVTVTVKREDGTTLVTGTAIFDAGTTSYRFVLAPQADLDVLTVEWSGAFSGAATTLHQTVEVVGARLATVLEVRAYGLADTTAYPTELLLNAITVAENVVADYCGTPFAERYEREVFRDVFGFQLTLKRQWPTRIVRASIDGTAVSAGDLLDWHLADDGTLTREDDKLFEPDTEVEVVYEHGYVPAPPELRWAVATLAAQWVKDFGSRIPDRTISLQSDFGQVQIAQAGGRRRPTSLPEVNAVLNRHRHRPPSVG